MTPSAIPALPYVDFATFLQRHFPGQKVQKITLTAGFSCPTRDGSMGKGGCTYCNNKSFSPNYATKLKSITEQINEGIAFFRRKYPRDEVPRLLPVLHQYLRGGGRLHREVRGGTPSRRRRRAHHRHAPRLHAPAPTRLPRAALEAHLPPRGVRCREHVRPQP